FSLWPCRYASLVVRARPVNQWQFSSSHSKKIADHMCCSVGIASDECKSECLGSFSRTRFKETEKGEEDGGHAKARSGPGFCTLPHTGVYYLTVRFGSTKSLLRPS